MARRVLTLHTHYLPRRRSICVICLSMREMMNWITIVRRHVP